MLCSLPTVFYLIKSTSSQYAGVNCVLNRQSRWGFYQHIPYLYLMKTYSRTSHLSIYIVYPALPTKYYHILSIIYYKCVFKTLRSHRLCCSRFRVSSSFIEALYSSVKDFSFFLFKNVLFCRFVSGFGRVEKVFTGKWQIYQADKDMTKTVPPMSPLGTLFLPIMFIWRMSTDIRKYEFCLMLKAFALRNYY